MFRPGWIAALGLAVAVAALAWSHLRQAQRPAGASKLERLARMPDFDFPAHDGSRVSAGDLRGRVWVANAVRTDQEETPSALTARMFELQEALKRSKAGGVSLISFTPDRQPDSPDELAARAREAGADHTWWKFLKGPETDVARTGLLEPAAVADGGGPARPRGFAVVDQSGWVRAFVDGDDPEAIQKLLITVGEVLREGPAT